MDRMVERGMPVTSSAPESASSTSSTVATHPTARRRRRSRYRNSGETRRRLLKAAAIVGVAIIALVIMVMSIGLSSLSAENTRLVAENNRKARELEQTRFELATVTEHRDTLVTGRIPRLHPLQFDQAIDIRQGYVRNVIFTLTRSSVGNTHEYRMVLHNDSLSVVQPKVKVVLFDAVGVQIGMAELNRATATAEKDRVLLDPGEVRSYSGIIPVHGREKPEYFLVLVD